MDEERPLFHCSFCGKSQTEVRRLIGSPRTNTTSSTNDTRTTCYNCDECVLLLMEILAEGRDHYGGWVQRDD